MALMERPKNKRGYRHPPGTAPGTLPPVDPNAPKAQLRIMAYGPDKLIEETPTTLDHLPALLKKWPVVWLNVDGPDPELLSQLGTLLNLHPLILEDVASHHQRPKAEDYDKNIFVVTRMAQVSQHTQAIDLEQVSLIMRKGLVLSFQERVGDCLDPVRDRLRKGKGRIRIAGADYLTYAILDAIVDGYFPVMEAFTDRLDALEDAVVSNPDSAVVAHIHALKRELLQLRRAIWPQRDMLTMLSHDQTTLFAPETSVFIRDCQDHVIQLIDVLETLRERASGLMDFYLSSVSNKMNEVMKTLTLFSTIFLPLSFIAGVYGMNFAHMPELRWAVGYPLALLLMLLVALGLLLYFKRRKWL